MHSDPASTYDPRVNGMTVRATAIANVQPALRVGAPAAGLPGATPFALDLAFWTALGSPQTVCSDPFGNLSLKPPPPATCSNNGAAGRYYVPSDQTPTMQTVGALVTATPPCAAVQPGSAYIPIYTAVSGNPLIIGFGFAQVAPNGCDVAITPTGSTMASANATVVVTGGFGAITPADLATVLADNAALAATPAGTLLAPAIVR